MQLRLADKDLTQGSKFISVSLKEFNQAVL